MNEREKTIAARIATVASEAMPYMLDETILLQSVNFKVRPKSTIDEFEKVCVKMEERAWIKRMRTDDGVKVKLTDEGKAELL